MNEYMTDDELLKLISDVEQNDLVKAPPQIAENVINKINKINKKSQVIEYRRFRNRVIASIAAILFITMSASSWVQFLPERVKKISYNEADFIYGYEADSSFGVKETQLFDDFGQSYYISNFLNKRED